MKFSLKVLVALVLSCVAAFAQSGQPIKQSGNTTPTHVFCVTTNGIAQDCGTAAIPFATTFGTWGTGPTICAWTALVTSGAAQQLCLGGTTSGGAELYVQNYGSAPSLPLTFSLNGTKYQFPYTVGGIVGPNSTVIGGVAVWGNNVGSLLADGAANDGYFGSGRPWCDPRAKGAKGDNSTDDTAAFNACVTAMASTGGTIYVSPGNYCLKTATSNHAAFVISSNAAFRVFGTGARGTASLSACGVNVQPFLLEAGEKSEVSNIQIVGYGAPTDTGLPSYPAFSMNNNNGGAQRLVNLAVFYGNPPVLVSTNDCDLESVTATLGYGRANILFQNANGCRLGGNSSVDQNSPIVNPLINSLTGAPPAWASSTFYGSSFTGSISGTTLTTSGATGTIAIGELVNGAGVLANTQITAGSGTSWTVSQSQTVGSEAMTGTGDIVTISGNRMQLLTAGTSGGTAPTIKPYSVNVTDGSAVWLLNSPSNFALIDLDTGAAEVIIDACDITGDADYDLELTNSLSGNPPSHVSITNVTLGGIPLILTANLVVGTGFTLSHSHLSGPAINATTQIEIQSTYGGGARFTDDEFINGGTNYALFALGGSNYTVAANVIEGGNFFGASGSSTNISIVGNAMSGVSTCLDIQNSVDYVVFSDNTCGSAGVMNGASGKNNRATDNPGLNPIGVSSGTYAPLTTATYTAGIYPEDHYLTGGTVSAVKIPNNSGTSICTTTPCFVKLGSNETMSVTYSGAPTDTVSVH